MCIINIGVMKKEGNEDMRRLWLLGICAIVLCGCMHREIYRVEEQSKEKIQLADDAYFMGGQSILTVEKSSYEAADTLYYAENEMELAKVIQYAMEEGRYEIAYQSPNSLDINKVASILSYVNPFDLSLTQNVVKYTSNDQRVLYASYHVEFENLDGRYEESQRYVAGILTDILKEDMSVNEKIKAIHDYIVAHTTYDIDAQKSGNRGLDVFKSAGVFVDKKAVCTGYSRAFMMLCRAAGIPAIYVASEAMNHSWNYVYDGHSWRYIDVTWDDPVPDRGLFVDDRFLNVGKEMFLLEGSHALTEDEQRMVEQIAESFF